MDWGKKYAPEKADEVPQKGAMLELSAFVKGFKRQRKKAVLIYGPSGSCKTTAVYALANELGLEILEVNASSFRNAEAINAVLGNAIKQQSLFHKGKIMLVDEIDGISGQQDRGGIPALVQLIQNSSFPVIMTANNPWGKKFSALRSKASLVEFKPVHEKDVVEVLKKICSGEKLDYDESALKIIAGKGNGDLRAAVNDLLCLSSSRITVEAAQLLNNRNRIESMLAAVAKILRSHDSIAALKAFDDIEENIDSCFLWLSENIPKEYKNARDLAHAYDALSKADVFRGRIIRRQHWRFLSHASAMLTVGIASSKTQKYSNGFVKYSSTRLLDYWRQNQKYAKRDEIVESIAEKTHSSSKKALQYSLPYFVYAAKKSKKFFDAFVKAFELEEEVAAWLRTGG